MDDTFVESPISSLPSQAGSTVRLSGLDAAVQCLTQIANVSYDSNAQELLSVALVLIQELQKQLYNPDSMWLAHARTKRICFQLGLDTVRTEALLTRLESLGRTSRLQDPISSMSVSYTHLTLPTKRIV